MTFRRFVRHRIVAHVTIDQIRIMITGVNVSSNVTSALQNGEESEQPSSSVSPAESGATRRKEESRGTISRFSRAALRRWKTLSVALVTAPVVIEVAPTLINDHLNNAHAHAVNQVQYLRQLQNDASEITSNADQIELAIAMRSHCGPSDKQAACVFGSGKMWSDLRVAIQSFKMHMDDIENGQIRKQASDFYDIVYEFCTTPSQDVGAKDSKKIDQAWSDLDGKLGQIIWAN